MSTKEELGEGVVHASVKLGIHIVREIANKTLTKNGNTTLRGFLKVLDEYERRQAAIDKKS